MPSAARGAFGADGRRGVYAMIGLLVIVLALRGATLLFDHNLNSIDGAMQTWFALDNFAHGRQLGEGFQSYLGITMILALLPAFMALGQTIFASTFAAYALVIAGAFASAYAIAWFLRFVPRGRRWAVAVLLLFGFYYAGRLAAGAVYYPYAATFDPGVSLRPLRGFLPFFVLPLFVLAVRSILAKHSVLPAVWLGLVAGIGLLWSNDAGIPLVLASIIALTTAFFQRGVLLLKTLFAFALGVVGGATGLLMLVTHGAPRGWLEYNFLDVAGDQFWYFAPWDRETRILAITDLPNIVLQGEPLTTLSLVLLIASVIIAGARRLMGRSAPVRTSAFIFVGSSVIGTALIPQIGGHIGPEYNGITFVLGLAAPVIVFQRAIWRGVKKIARKIAPVTLPAAGGAAALAMIAIDAGTLALTINTTERTVYADKLGFYVTPAMAEDLAAMERLAAHWDARGIAPDDRLLSVYTSSLDIAAGTRSPEPVGSLIHALGPKNRTDFTARIANRSVAAVSTIAPDYSGWEGWILRANWPFFESLFAYYDPIARTDQHILWVPSRGRGPFAGARCTAAQKALNILEINVEARVDGIASIYLERAGGFATGRSALLTVTEDSAVTRAASEPAWSGFPRYGIANERIVALAVPVRGTEPTSLTLEVLDGSAIGTAECFISVFREPDFAALPGLSEGIDRHIAGAEAGR